MGRRDEGTIAAGAGEDDVAGDGERVQHGHARVQQMPGGERALNLIGGSVGGGPGSGIRRLEQLYGERRVIPSDPVVAFLDALIEDYADEWLTKAMFHYRWAFAADADKAAKVLPLASATKNSSTDGPAIQRIAAEKAPGTSRGLFC